MSRLNLLCFWLFSSGLYLINVLPISPVYLCFIIVCSLLLISLVTHKINEIHYITIGFLFLSIYIISYQSFLTTPAQTINVFMTFFSPVIVYFLFDEFDEFDSFSLLNKLCVFYFILFIIDGVWRLYHPGLVDNIERLEELGVGLHIYKINSLMYIDSNFVGVHSVFIFSLYLWNVIQNSQKLSLWILALAGLAVFLTFSRSAEIGVILALYFFICLKYKRIGKISYILAIPVAIMCSYYIAEYYKDDISFNSKFRIISLAYEYLWSADLSDIILGVGSGNTESVLNIGAHNFFVAVIIELGVLGFAVLMLYLLFFTMKLGLSSLVLILPFITSNMAAGSLAMPYFFTLLAFCSLIYKKEKVEDNLS